jgi:multisubunit Na+/H+ antiporter MnhB subunit
MAQRLAAVAFIFALVAGYFLFAGFTLDTSVATGEGGSVANLQLMHVQAMQVGIGIGAAVIASIFAIGAAIISSRG